MSTTQPETLRLASILRGIDARSRFGNQQLSAASEELERLHAENADLRAKLASIGAGGVSALMGAANAGSEAVKRDLRRELQQQCSTWGTYWRASDSHGVVLSHSQAVELLQNALGVEVEVEVRGCQACDYTGMICDVPCPACTHPSPPEGMAGWRPLIEAPVDEIVLVAAEFAGPGDWRIKCGYLDGQTATWRAFGSSWEPTHWMPLPAPPLASEAKEPK